MALDFIEVVHAADVGMRHLSRHPHLGVQLREAGRVSIDIRWQELERNRLPEFQIVGAEDLAHAATSQSPDDPVTSAEERPGREAAVIDRARGREPAARRGDGFLGA